MLCYFTTQAPNGPGESFVLREVDTSIELGERVLIIPVRPKDNKKTKYATWICKARSLKTFWWATLYFLLHPLAVTKIFFKLLFSKNDLKNTARNLALFPKALATCFYLKDKSIKHIHAHWLATTSTVAMIVAELLSIPWSCTGHRFDVYTKNMFKEKAKSSCFIRLIDENGFRYFKENIPHEYHTKVHKIHLGVSVPINPPPKATNASLKFIMPANYIEIKGHSYVIEAFDRVVRNFNPNVQLDLFGQGPLEDTLKSMVNDLGLSDNIHFCDLISNQELLDKYKRSEYRALLLPSLDLGKGEHEGIPVSLMEAMAYGLAVVSCPTGGIRELLDPENSYLVEPQNVGAIEAALIDLLDENNRTNETKVQKAYNTVSENFDTYKNTSKLIDLMNTSCH